MASSALEDSATALNKSVTTIAVAATGYNLAIDQLRQASLDGIAAMGDIGSLGPQLSIAAADLDLGVRDFTGPADRMTEVLDRLAESIGNFAKGINLNDT